MPPVHQMELHPEDANFSATQKMESCVDPCQVSLGWKVASEQLNAVSIK